MRILPLAALLPVAALISSCAPKINARTSEAMAAAGPGDFADVSPHRSEYVHANDDVRFNFLDWGGNGPNLVLIHDIGDSPHIFDDLAPRLRPHFRVVALARRGHGRSEAPEGKYDQGTLVYDVYKLFESMGIDRASLLGWGAGGNEITAFAARFPDRVEKLIYLDAGYDYADPAFNKALHEMLIATAPDQSAMGSIEAYRAWFESKRLGKTAGWNQSLEAYLRDASIISPDGTVAPVPHDRVMNAVYADLLEKPRDYSAVKAPALVLYASSFFPLDQDDPALAEKVRNFEQKTMTPFRQASMERVTRELRNVKVAQIPERTHMSIGVQSPDTLAFTIRDFLRSR